MNTFVFYLALTTTIEIIEQSSSGSISNEEVLWLAPVHWSSKFQALPEKEQKDFLKLNGKVFDCSSFDYYGIAEKSGLLAWCNVDVVNSTFCEYKMKMKTLVRSLVNELGKVYWTNQSLNSSFRTMESFERHELICGLKMTFPKLATKYGDFFEMFCQDEDLSCTIKKTTFKRTFNVCNF